MKKLPNFVKWFIMNDLPANAAEMAGQDNQE